MSYPGNNNGNNNNESPENALARLTAEVEAENSGNVSKSVFNNIRAQQAEARKIVSEYGTGGSAAAPSPVGTGPATPSPFMTMLFGSKATAGAGGGGSSRPVGGGGGGGGSSRPVGGGGGGGGPPLNKAGAVHRMRRATMLEESVARSKAMATQQVMLLKQLESAGATKEKTEPMRQSIRTLLAKVEEMNAEIKNLKEEVKTRYKPSRHRRSKKRATRRKHRN
jgi:hypothetical protein